MLRSDGADVQSMRTYGTGNCATNAGRRRPEIMLNRTCRALQRYAALQLDGQWRISISRRFAALMMHRLLEVKRYINEKQRREHRA